MRRSSFAATIVIALAIMLSSCSLTPGTPPGPGTLTISPTTADVRAGSTQQFTPSVTTKPLTWSVNGVVGGSVATGTIDTSGNYTAPTTLPSPNTVTIEAAETAMASVNSSSAVTLWNPIPQITSISPSPINVGAFTLTISGSGFVNGATVSFGGSTLMTSFVSGTQLTATGTASTSQVGAVAVEVTNPDPGSVGSNQVNAQVAGAITVTATAAARFLDQSSFGPTATSIAHVQQIGLQAALTEQFNQPPTLFSEPPSPGPAQCTSNWHCTQSEFLNVAVWGNDQLRQRVAMALSEIFVAPTQQNNAMPFYLNTLAGDAFTNYRTIMQDATLSPAMGDYLNMLNSPKPPTGQIANENYGREMMQLFSLGVNLLNPDGTLQTDSSGNPIPTYTEPQVEAFARAYTGWTNANTDGSTPSSFNYTYNWLHLMVPVENQHDTSQKILLNGTTLPAGQTAEEDLKGALDNIFAHPNIGPFVCRQLIQHLVTGDPSPAYVSRVAAVFADNGSGVRGDMKAVITAILMDSEARAGDTQTGDEADATPAVNGGHLREPLLWTMNLLRGLNAPSSSATSYPFVSFMSQAVASVGEAPFSQTSVFNFFPPSYVIPQTTINAPEFSLENTASVIPRMSLADKIIHNEVSGPMIDLSATSVIGQQASNPAGLVDYLGMVFMHSQMPSDMRTALISTISAIPSTNLQSRAEVAVYLVVSSAEYKIMH
ncbi:MAG: DUF1800 family protein [Candidatus Acidiferrales bacterium]